MRSAEGAPHRRHAGWAACLLLAATAVWASPVRVATLGGDGRLLLDSTNLFDYPALVRQLAQADVELYDEWAGVALPLGERHGVAVFLNRPDADLDDLSAYLSGTGSRLLRSLRPRPWLDAVYGLQVRPGLTLATGLRYAYDVRDRGVDEAGVSRWDGRLGVAAGRGARRLDGTLTLQRLALRDRSAGVTRRESDGTGLGVDLRGRWSLGDDAVLLPSLLWRRSGYGLAPETRESEELRGALALNVRPTPTVLGVLGVIVGGRRDRQDVAGDALGPVERRRWLLPALVAGGELQAGALVFRLGLRHESVVDEVRGTDVDLAFDTGLVTDVGLGFEFGAVAIDGRLQKDFLRDGPDFLGGSPHGGGLLSTLSILYRMYP